MGTRYTGKWLLIKRILKTMRAFAIKTYNEPWGFRLDLQNFQHSFTSAPDIELEEFERKPCMVYIDDIIIFSLMNKENITPMHEIMLVLKDPEMSLNFKKCLTSYQSI